MIKDDIYMEYIYSAFLKKEKRKGEKHGLQEMNPALKP